MAIREPVQMPNDAAERDLSERRAAYRASPIGHWLVRLSRVAIELHEEEAFAGTVIHELCHVYLEHDADMYRISTDHWQQLEDEAVALGCELGFRRETEAYISALKGLFGDAAETGRLPPKPS